MLFEPFLVVSCLVFLLKGGEVNWQGRSYSLSVKRDVKWNRLLLFPVAVHCGENEVWCETLCGIIDFV